jgi:hypothetical protein
VELLGRYSSYTYWTERVESLGKTVSERQERRPRVRKSARRLAKHQVSELIAGYQDGATVYELAQRFRIHRVTVSALLHRSGVEMRGAGLDEAQIDRAVALYAQGWSVASIGREVGIDGTTVWRRFTQVACGFETCRGGVGSSFRGEHRDRCLCPYLVWFERVPLRP